MEIERKFLVKDLNKVKEIIKLAKKNEIIQDYLYIDDYTVVRKRKIVEEKIIKYKYTVKTMKTGISVNEFEKEITEREYEKLQINNKYFTLKKDRYIIPYFNNLNIELDIFHDIYEGVIFAEIEFKDEIQANEMEIPNWFYKDISNLYTNSQMAFENLKENIIGEK